MKKIIYKVGDTINNGVGDVARIMQLLDNDEYSVIINACNRTKVVSHTQLVRGTFVTKRGSKYAVGKQYKTIQGRPFTITEIIDTNRRKVKFSDDNTEAIVYTSYMNTGNRRTRGKFTLGSKHKTRDGSVYIITEIVDLYRRRIKFIKSKNERVVFTSAMYCGSIDDKVYVPKASKCSMERIPDIATYQPKKPNVRSTEDMRADMLSLDINTTMVGSHNINNRGDEYVIECASDRSVFVHFLRSDVTKWVDKSSIYRGSVMNGYGRDFSIGTKHKFNNREFVILDRTDDGGCVAHFTDDNSKRTLSAHHMRSGNSGKHRRPLKCGDILPTTQCGTILILGRSDRPHRCNILFNDSGIEKDADIGAIRKGTVSDRKELKLRMMENDAQY